MIVIVDNGGEYDLHHIYYVEAPNVQFVDAALEQAKRNEDAPINQNARVIGTAEGLCWVKGEERTMSLKDFQAELNTGWI